ncbi:hypothetical protein MMC34_004813 [Xylographa carneopallida]|nr:hypothetical protein [Xylographa carneopallida]
MLLSSDENLRDSLKFNHQLSILQSLPYREIQHLPFINITPPTNGPPNTPIKTSCPTAQRWFVSDDEFDTATEDYVFCNARAEAVKDEVAYFDDISWDCPDVPKNFFQEAKLRWGNFFTSFYFGGRLIYADAHLADPKNWQGILQKR